MSTYSKIFVAVIVILFTLNSSALSRNWTEEEIYEEVFLESNTFTPADGDVFTEDIRIPPPKNPDWGENEDLATDTYTIEFGPGVDVTFDEGCSLTIQTTVYGEGGGATTGTGRINAHGNTDVGGGLVTFDMDDAAAWGGIIIQTDPGGSGNILNYCQISNAGNVNIPINQAILVDGDDAQLVVSNCIIANATSAGIWATGGEYSFNSNSIHDMNWGIVCQNAMQGTPQERKMAIVNNIIYDNEHQGILVQDDWDGGIFNNIVYSNTDQEILLNNAAPGAWVVNNTVDDGNDTQSGIECQETWCTNIFNNIIMDCDVGIQGINEANTYRNCLFFSNGDDDDLCFSSAGSNTANPEFVRLNNTHPSLLHQVFSTKANLRQHLSLQTTYHIPQHQRMQYIPLKHSLHLLSELRNDNIPFLLPRMFSTIESPRFHLSLPTTYRQNQSQRIQNVLLRHNLHQSFESLNNNIHFHLHQMFLSIRSHHHHLS
jgi:parallel beta-helix repeat protein